MHRELAFAMLGKDPEEFSRISSIFTYVTHPSLALTLHVIMSFLNYIESEFLSLY